MWLKLAKSVHQSSNRTVGNENGLRAHGIEERRDAVRRSQLAAAAGQRPRIFKVGACILGCATNP